VEIVDRHRWVRARLAARSAGLLTEDETRQIDEHLAGCPECRQQAESFEGTPAESGAVHVAAPLMARWPEARQRLSGLERAMVRRHLERCAECRQDLELLGHAPRLEYIPELEIEGGSIPSAAGATAAAAPAPTSRATPAATVIRVVAAGVRRRWRERALLAWATLATATAVVTIVIHSARPVVEGVPAALWATLPPPVVAPSLRGREGPTVRLAPRPRSLSGPARGTRGGKVTVIPVVGPVGSLALSVRPLDVPDTAMVMVVLLAANGDTLFKVRHRQWEFFPKQVLVIDGGRSPLPPGPYVLELASLIAQPQGPVRQLYRYPFELRPRH
jgi:hypothetical protein